MPAKVFVSGCFDMLHSGHVAFLEEAATHGELYVGIGSDRTVLELKGRRTICKEAERLYMVKALRCVKDAWVSSGSGVMDFEDEVRALHPDIFFVNSDGYTPEKEAFCRGLGIRLMLSRRLPHEGLPPRSTTALRRECAIPYRIELGGGWLDQPDVSRFAPGAVVTVSIKPRVEYNDRSGLATSSRKKAVELWSDALPKGDRAELAKMLFALENPPGTKYYSGSQDQLGMLLPGINRLYYDNSFWPSKIDSILDEATIAFVEAHLRLLALPPRPTGFSVREETRITEEGVRRLARAADGVWEGIRNHDLSLWGASTTAAFEAAVAMFPRMLTDETAKAIEAYRGRAAGWKLTGAGGGGYLVLVSEEPIPEAQTVEVCRE